MITKFSVLYVGHIELEDVGRDGTPADERRYPNERLVEAYDNVEGARTAHGRARLLLPLDGRAPLPARRATRSSRT